ncbi:MAG TPA: serine/threonine-protein kinase [Polyangia bacterium]|nr:serine/threonine-protein kinase [Polyangia bacterium]
MRAEVSPRGEDGASDESQTAVERAPVRIDEEASEPLPAGTVLGGRYEVRKLIGRGGMGLVVEAWDATLGVAVAIKIVRSEYAGERQWSERLAREVKLARKIQHPNVCRVFDFGQADGRAFLSMELAEGGTLRSQLAEGAAGARPLADRLADARAVAAGVAAIHAAGIVHRDLSPQNVLRMKDGRLVVSDFGLATDSFDGASSIHGGTVAYMAPEVLRGGRASMAADIWSLGAVIHEVVFGERLRWDAKSAEVRSAVAGQALTSVERSVLEICRACTTPDPARRPRDAGQVAAQLGEAALSRAGRRRWQRRAIAAATAGLVIVAAVAGARLLQLRRRRAVQVTAAAVDPLLVVPTGEPDDWTNKSKVLAEVPDRVRCMVALPDHRTVRFVWGYPARAVDVDTRTGEQKPSPLVPDAYAEGCPDLSADGRRLVYTGHTPDERAFAFVSMHADGRDGIPAVQTGEPGAYSDPVWLADGETFAYDVDDKHIGVFSMATRRSLVVPTPATPYLTSFHSVVGNRIFVGSPLENLKGTEIAAFDYPSLNAVSDLQIGFWMTDLRSEDGTTYYFSVPRDKRTVLVALDAIKHRARFVGEVRAQSLRRPVFLEDGLAFWSFRYSADLLLREPGHDPRRVPLAADIRWAIPCGDKIVAALESGSAPTLVWLGRRGEVGESLGEVGMGVAGAECSADGKTTFFSVVGDHPGIRRCDQQGCRLIFSGVAYEIALSRDERRLAFVSPSSGGRIVRWMSADGIGEVRELIDSETGCQPIWSSERDVWVSLRKGRQVIWTEMDSDSGRPTGRTYPASRDCTDGLPDPVQPLHRPAEIEVNFQSQLRLLPTKYLPTVVKGANL